MRSKVILTAAHLPWSGQPVRQIENIQPWLASRMAVGLGAYLSKSITLMVDPSVVHEVDSFLEELAGQLQQEIDRRLTRQRRFIKMGLFSERELDSILTGNSHVQPWLLYLSQDGGVGEVPVGVPERDKDGYKPCSSMTNHGVAWTHTASGEFRMWLVTARKVGQPWDWDSDIGHESAHAAFAPVPLFTQIVQASVGIDVLTRTEDPAMLSDGELGKLGYPYSEIAVVGMRGESRATSTGLPVVETPEQLHKFLSLSDALMPGVGFDKALQACDRVRGRVDVNEGQEVFEIAAPVLRIMPALASVAKSLTPPPAEWYAGRQLAFQDAVSRLT